MVDNRFLRFFINIAITIGVCLLIMFLLDSGFIGSAIAESYQLEELFGINIIMLAIGGTFYYLGFELFGASDDGCGYIIRAFFYILGRLIMIFSVIFSIVYVAQDFSFLSDANPFVSALAIMWIMFFEVLFFAYYFELEHFDLSGIMQYNIPIALIASYIISVIICFISSIGSLYFLMILLPVGGVIAGAIFDFIYLKEWGLMTSDSDTGLLFDFDSIGEICEFVLPYIGQFLLLLLRILALVLITVICLAIVCSSISLAIVVGIVGSIIITIGKTFLLYGKSIKENVKFEK